jgi:hypothetical protein
MTDLTMFAFPSDMLDEGPDAALDRIAGAGMHGISLAALYHDGRDLLPHNPRVRVKFQEDGAAFFGFDETRFGRIKPIRSAGGTPFDQVRDAAHSRGLTTTAWAVFLHNTSLGRRNVDAVTRNVFGDPQLTSLCPANPAAAEYALATAAAIADSGVDALNAEGLHYLPLEHGYHHERYFLRIGPIDRLLLGICFCPHCCDRAAKRGVDVATLVAGVRDRLERVFATAAAFDPEPDAPDRVAALWGGALSEFLASREATVTELAAAVHDTLRARSIKFIFNDPAGALRKPGTDTLESDESWRLGIDATAIAAVCDEIQVLGYSVDPAVVERDVDDYLRRTGSTVSLRVALRPTFPDCESTENLAEKLRRLRKKPRVGAFDFYAYDFMRLDELDRVRDAVADAV